tara:strand:- start:7599 stop:8285 length:687 start_codon:yes stop_codon:yes gene_type:complete
MVYLPDKLPKMFIDLCWKVKREFVPGKPNWQIFGKALTDAKEYDRSAVLALFIGLESAMAWLEVRDRKDAQETAQLARETVRRRRKRPFFKDLFASAQGLASVTSEAGVKQTQSLILYGFVLHHGASSFEELDWSPLLDALASILLVGGNPDDADVEVENPEAKVKFSDIARKQTSELMRLRIYRLRKLEAHDKAWVREHATQYFQELYAISTKTRRVRTLQERTSKR